MKITFDTPVMTEIYEKLKEHEIEYTFSMEHEEIQVSGFSKSGIATLKEEDGKVLAYTRYERVDELTSFEDLVKLNYEWFDLYRDRKPFTSPSDGWADVLVQYGYVKRVKETRTYYK